MTPSGIELATFRLLARYLNQLRHRVPPSPPVVSFIYYLTKLLFMLQNVMVQDVTKGFRPGHRHELPVHAQTKTLGEKKMGFIQVVG
jgi:hypothetical protein